MPDIYARSGQDFKGSFAADAARVVFAGSSGDGLVAGVGLLTQTLNVNYAQAIQRLYEIGTNFTYFIAGRTQGSVGLGRVLGPRPVQLAFYRKYGNVCNAATNNLNFEAATGCDAAGNTQVRFGIRNSVISNMSLAVNANDMMINEQLQMMFISLDLQ